MVSQQTEWVGVLLFKDKRAIRDILKKLEAEWIGHWFLLERLINLCCKIASHSDQNEMTPFQLVLILFRSENNF